MASPPPVAGPGATFDASAHPVFERVLSRVDLLLFSVCAILTIDSLATAASMGVAWFTWWVITMVVFFVPYGLVTAELGAAWPGEGGVYLWVREGLGRRWGSLVAWLYWINNAYWIPAVYLVFAGTFHSIFLKGRWPGLDDGAGATWLEAGIAIVLTWLTVALGIVRLEVSKWVPNLGAVVKVAIFLGLGALGLQFILAGRTPANDFSLAAFVPRWTDSLAFLPILLYNTLGFELMSSAGEEMKEPQRDVPRVVLLSGLIIGFAYMLGALGILLAVPLEKLSLTTGTWDALAALGPQWGSAGEALTLLLGIGFLYACIANVVTWSLGVNRVAAIAAEDHMLPSALGRLHPLFQTPHVAFVVMGVVATALLVGNALLSSNPQNVFWMIFKLSSLCLLLCYLAMFPAFLVLRHTRAEAPRPYRLPGGAPCAWAATVVCWLFVFLTSLLFFKPAPGAAEPLKEAWLLGGETLLTIVVGVLLVPRRADREPRESHPERTSPRPDEIRLRDFARRYTAAWCSQDPSRVAAFFSESGSLRVNDDPPAVGRTAITEVAGGFMNAFPDLQVLMDDVQADPAVYRWTLIGTHRGGPGGTGRSVRISGYEEWRLGADGLIAESRGHFDREDYARQLEGREVRR